MGNWCPRSLKARMTQDTCWRNSCDLISKWNPSLQNSTMALLKDGEWNKLWIFCGRVFAWSTIFLERLKIMVLGYLH